ncbi:CubicO group peptidase (beta-lactamase class C family) [Jiangella mangrovi]|uniref:CubicO group peptidase (Beta-lactamase class C family) n=1 Tax=Jiangella mangrovi TaxID=1524084 RepID=A0A7W9GPJ6_9ACTN|nr:CubicO group peptidase (beta-lactamase class C family) [Jiangella mangrovi]
MIQPSTANALTRRVAEEQAGSRLPSLAAGVVRNGTLVWFAARGTLDGRATGRAADEHTQYRMGSITKTFVAVAVMRLRDEGALDLGDPLEKHLPDTSIGDATIAQLLSHGAGLQAETDGPWWERTEGGPWRSLSSQLGRRHPAGRLFHYSNVGFGVLGELVGRLRGTAWSNVVAEELLEPLGMDRTTKRPVAPHAHGLAVHPFADLVLREPEHDGGAMAPAGQLWSTVRDLGRWAAFLGGDTAGLLSAASLAEMCKPLVVVDVPGAPWTGAHGLGVQLWNDGGRRFTGHGGSMPGFLAEVRVDVETGDGVVLATNATSGLSRGFAAGLLDAFVAAEPLPPAVWQSGTVSPEVLALVGHWYWGSTTFVLRAMDGGWLRLGPADGAGRASRFRPDGEGGWVGLDGYYAGEPLRVVRRADGAVSHLDLASFVFTRTPYDPSADVPGGVDHAGWH